MKLIVICTTCLALSACATSYVSELAQPNYGRHGFSYSEGDVDPTLLMNGSYAAKQMNGSYAGAFCLADRCSLEAPLWASGWAP